MGLFDDVKDSIPGHHSDSGSSSTSGSDFDSSKFEESFDPGTDAQQDIGQGGHADRNDPSTGNNPRQGDIGREPQGQPQQNTGGRNQDVGRGRNDGRDIQGSRGRGNQSPNAQAGRPEPGSSEPQLSSNTQRKMENAGMDVNRNSKQPVAERRDDIEELKSQNEQIIELLKRISESLRNEPSPGRRSGRR